MTQSEQTAADPASAILNIVTDLGRQLAQSAKTLTETRDDEVEIGTAAKDEVWRSDKVIKRLADWMFAQQQAKDPSGKLASQGNG